jgi:excinuclease ABC subunit A
MAEQVLRLPSGSRLLILAPLIRDRKGEHKQVIKDAKTSGYARVRLDGTVYSIEEALALDLDRQRRHSVEIVVDRYFLEAKPDRPRLVDSLETATRLGNGLVVVVNTETKQEWSFSEEFACPDCGMSMPAIEPRDFSFNSPHGACPDCTGLGTKQEVDADLVIPNKKLSLSEGAIKPWSKSGRSRWYDRLLRSFATQQNFSIDVPISRLAARDVELILYGSDVPISVRTRSGTWETTYEGVIPQLMRRYKEAASDGARADIEQYMVERPCPTCQGKRLKPEPLAVLVGEKNIHEVVTLSIDDTLTFFTELQDGKDATFDATKQKIAFCAMWDCRT